MLSTKSTSHRIVFTLTFLLVTISGFVRASETTAACGKSCLSDITERYVEAMVKGTINGVSLAAKVRVTSNSQLVKAGEGDTWQAGITIVNRYTFVDPVTQTSIFFGTIAGKPDSKRKWWHYAVRLSVDGDGAIYEIEEQSNPGGFSAAGALEVPYKEAAIFDTVLPEDERVSAEDLIQAADSYWDGLSSGEGEQILFGPDCQRSEFGAYTTNNFVTLNSQPVVTNVASDAEFAPEARTGSSCRSVFYVNERFHWPTDNRRYYVVDEARGVLVGIGQLKKFSDKGIPGLTLIEAFKIVNGRIQFLWAPAFTFGIEASGWPDWKRP